MDRLRNVKAQSAVERVSAVDIEDRPENADIVELLDAAITETGVAGIGAVAYGPLPFGIPSAVRQVDRVAGTVIVEAGKVKTAQVAVGRENVSWLFFVGVIADRIADVGHGAIGKICRGAALNVVWTRQDLWGHDLIRGDAQLHIRCGIVGAVRLAAPFGLIHQPGVLAIVIVGPQSHAQPDLLEVVSASDALGFGLGSGEGGKQHTRKDSDNGDNHEQLDERESARRQLRCSFHAGLIIVLVACRREVARE